MTGRFAGSVKIGLAVLVRPQLWATALGVMRAHVISSWWNRSPFLPRPSRSYLAFRMETQYGDARELTSAPPDDVVKYLGWVKEWNRRR